MTEFLWTLVNSYENEEWGKFSEALELMLLLLKPLARHAKNPVKSDTSDLEIYGISHPLQDTTFQC